jgi:hypothetical protein
MQISYTSDAFAALIKLVNFIEDKITQGAGLRWLDRYEAFLNKKLPWPEHVKLCHNQTFNKLKLRCLYFNEWVNAFSYNENAILIEALIHRSRIID